MVVSGNGPRRWTTTLRRWRRRRGRTSGSAAAAAPGRRRPSWLLHLDVEASALATSVAVMAPALTEAAGPQKPENLIIPALPAGGFLSAEQAKQVCQNREVLAQFVVSANVQPSKIDEQCLQGIPKDLINDVINGLDNLSDLIAGVAAPRKEASDDAIMSDPSVGDPADSMCYYNKPTMGPVEDSESCEVADGDGATAQGAADDVSDDAVMSEDKQTDEDGSFELLNMGFGSGLSVATSEYGQVDEIMRVINSMENAEGTADGMGNDVRLTGGSSHSEIFPDGEAFSLNLLSDVDVMGLVNNIPVDGVVDSLQQQQQNQLQLQTDQTNKLNELSQHQAQVERRQHEIERRTAFLMRRLRRLQARIVGEHAADEAGHVLELAQQSAKKSFYEDLASLGPKAGNTRNFPDMAGSMSSFVQKVQKSCTAQSNSIAVRQRNSSRYFGAGSRDNFINPAANRMPVFGVPQIKLKGEQVEKVAGPLASKLKILQNGYDSDCTASSSGGESCDEMQTFNNTLQQQVPISRRAGWRYAQERASVASRWTWLQAQISDLEYRIRQHTDLQRQIRATKGLVVLEAVPAAHGGNDSPMLSAEPAALNGYSGALPGSTAASACGGEDGFGSSRTRPFCRPVFRKRKLAQLHGLHEVSKKAARPASLRCDCLGGLACALCTGRREPAAGQQTAHLSLPERLASVDAGYHPVLSLPDDVTHHSHMDAVLRSAEWQQRMVRGGMRVAKLKDKEVNDRRPRKLPAAEHRAKYSPAAAAAAATAKPKKSPTALIGAKIKRKALKGNQNRSSGERTPNHGASRKRGPKSQNHNQLQQSQPSASLDDDEEGASGPSCSSKYSSPVPSPLQQHALPPPGERNAPKEKSSNSHSRLRQNSYDIDNIVIPYSVAASTRLEKLQYKEIMIPKWRVCEDPPNPDIKNGAVPKSAGDSDVEDVTDDTVALRHERSERDENRRFMNFANLPYHSRMRHSRRTDSRTDSGANTPDPLSPHASDFGGDTMSPITSPPATPSNVQDSEHSQQAEAHHRSGSLPNAMRRRTMSSSARPQREDPSTSFVEEEFEQVLPYEPRSFPLPDEDYDRMLEVMPNNHLQSISNCPQEEEKIDNPVIQDADSQESDSTESALCEMDGEDPNDPEWTVAEARETEKERIRPTAKR